MPPRTLPIARISITATGAAIRADVHKANIVDLEAAVGPAFFGPDGRL